MSGPRLHPAPPRGCRGSVPPATSLSPQRFCGSASVLSEGAEPAAEEPGGAGEPRAAGTRGAGPACTDCHLVACRNGHSVFFGWFLALTRVLCPAAPEDLGGRLRGVEDTDPAWTLPHRCSGLVFPFLLPPAMSPAGWGSSYICSVFSLIDLVF